MKTLRVKIALLLVISIVSVVALITLAVLYLFSTPKNEQAVLLAQQLIIMNGLAKQGSASDTPIAGHANTGIRDEEQTELLKAATARLGTPLDVVVTHSADDSRFRVVSLRVGPTRSIEVQIDPPSDPELWFWFGFITIGVGSIAVFTTHRLSRPLALLESAAESVTPEGVLPALAEQGPAEVRATAAAINSLAARLKRATESRMRLVAAAGHDLRTPLTRMRLRAEFVGDDADRALWLKDLDELERIAESAIQLVREETTTSSPEVIRVDELVRGIVTELQAQKFQIEMSDSREAYVKASRLALSRALRNIFINAATHGVRGTVRVLGGEKANIIISDEGPGISADILDQVFEPFFRANRARSQDIPGVGLGLSISKEIVRRIGGDIKIFNRSEGGLVQIVELPSITQ